MVVVKGEASEREKGETNAKEDEKFNAKEEEELNAMEEGKLPVRWSWLGEVEEEEKFRWNLTVPTASELFSFEAEEPRRRKKEEGGGRRGGEGGLSSGQQDLLSLDFTNVTLAFEDCGEVPLVEGGGEIIFNIFKMENYFQISRSCCQ